ASLPASEGWRNPVRLLPRKTEYFDLLARHGDNIVAMCERLLEMLTDFKNVPAKQAALKELEHVGDRLTHELFTSMHATFVTPLDKDDLAALAGSLDDVADYIDAAAERFVIYNIERPTAEARELARLLLETAQLVASSVRGLRDLRDRDSFFRAFREIHDLENQSDTIYRTALGNLFNAPDAHPILVLKWKEIYERMEMAVD